MCVCVSVCVLSVFEHLVNPNMGDPNLFNICVCVYISNLDLSQTKINISVFNEMPWFALIFPSAWHN